MADYKSIEEYRSKKKKKNFLKKFFLILFLFSVLIALLYILQNFKGSNLNDIINKDLETNVEDFPIIIKNEQLMELYSVGNNIGVLTKSNASSYAVNGKKENKVMHGYANPIVVEGNKRVLLYDCGGNSLRVDNATGNIAEKKIKDQIILADINQVNGNVVVVTNNERYACVITVYDASLNERYNFSSTERISDVCFSPDNQHILATAIVSVGGMLSTQLYELNIQKVDDINKMLIHNLFPLDVRYNENHIEIIGKDKLVTYDFETKTQKEYVYNGKLLFFENGYNKEAIFITDSYLNSQSTLVVVGSDCKVKYSYNLVEEVADLYSDGSRILVLTRQSVYNFDMTLKLLNTIKLESSFNHLIHLGNNGFLMGTDRVEKIKID